MFAVLSHYAWGGLLRSTSEPIHKYSGSSWKRLIELKTILLVKSIQNDSSRISWIIFRASEVVYCCIKICPLLTLLGQEWAMCVMEEDMSSDQTIMNQLTQGLSSNLLQACRRLVTKSKFPRRSLVVSWHQRLLMNWKDAFLNACKAAPQAINWKRSELYRVGECKHCLNHMWWKHVGKEA